MRKRFFALLFICFLTFILSSCASIGPTVSKAEIKKKEAEFQAKFYQASGNWLPKVYRVGYRLITAPVPGHGDAEPKFNFAGIGVDELKEAGRKTYGIPPSIKGVLVLGVYPGSQAEAVDLQQGDVIIALDGKKTKNLGAYFKRIRTTDQKTVKAKVWRKREILEREIPIEKVYYNAQFFVSPTPHLEASSLFSKINIGIGALRYCRNDDELAVIMGHELAHTTLKHSLKNLGANIGMGLAYGVAGAAIDAFLLPGIGTALMTPAMEASQAALSRRYEREADYFGMQHAFHAGYDVQNGMKVFSRLAVDTPGFEVLAYTFASHPKAPERFLRLEKIVEEFKANYPDKFPMTRHEDWEITVPVQVGESLEEALERIIKQKLDEKPGSNSTGTRAEEKQPIQEQSELTTGGASGKRSELRVPLDEEHQTLQDGTVGKQDGPVAGNQSIIRALEAIALEPPVTAATVAKTSGTDTATSASQDRILPFEDPAPKT